MSHDWQSTETWFACKRCGTRAPAPHANASASGPCPKEDSRSFDEPVLDTPDGIGRDEQHRFLAERERNVLGQKLSPLKDRGAAATGRAHDHLDHVPVLTTALPNATRLEESRVGELLLDHRLDGLAERLIVERDRQLLVATDIAGHASTDVEAHGAGRAESHAEIVPTIPSAGALKARTRPGPHRFYLFFEVDRTTGQLTLETSWLPDLPAVAAALGPMGFVRRPDGSHYLQMSDAADQLAILRSTTKVLHFLLAEATL
jgi:hypothetical protein